MRKNHSLKNIAADELRSDELWKSIRYLDPGSDDRKGIVPGLIAVIFVALIVSVMLFTLRIRGL